MKFIIKHRPALTKKPRLTPRLQFIIIGLIFFVSITPISSPEDECVLWRIISFFQFIKNIFFLFQQRVPLCLAFALFQKVALQHETFAKIFKHDREPLEQIQNFRKLRLGFDRIEKLAHKLLRAIVKLGLTKQ